MRLPFPSFRSSSRPRSSFLSRSAFALAALSVLAVAAPAVASGEKDKEAMKLHDQAMNEDYLNVAFDKAEKKLKDALKKCGKDACSKEVLGKVHVALATVYGGQSKLDLAKEELIAALKADPKAALDDSLKTPELEKAFAEAKKAAGGKEEPPKKEPGGEDGEDGEKPGKKPGGDMSHTPPAEQAVNHPVPIYIEVPEEIGATKVTLRYKPFGATKWKSLEMQKVGDGFGVEIPCDDVTTTGDIKYYVIAKDSEGNPAGTAGSLKEPYKVPIKNDIEGDAPSLPGKKAPDKCAVKEDCPPGLPGCPEPGAKHGDKGWGASCEQSQECQAGLVCLNGSCEEGKDDGGDKKAGGKKNFVSLAGQFDFLIVGSANDVCSGKDASYVCFYPDGNQFYGNPVDKTGTNGVQGGFAFGDLRALAGFDRVLLAAGPGSLAVGARAGFAFGGSPSSDKAPSNPAKKVGHTQARSFLPLHLEARGSYMLELGNIHPYGFVGGGLAQVNASVKVSVCDQFDKAGNEIGSGDADDEASSTCPKNDTGDFDGSVLRKDLDAYQITGLGFVDAGGGAVIFFDPKMPVGIAAELKVMFMLPTFGIVVAPTVGPVFAF